MVHGSPNEKGNREMEKTIRKERYEQSTLNICLGGVLVPYAACPSMYDRRRRKTMISGDTNVFGADTKPRSGWV